MLCAGVQSDQMNHLEDGSQEHCHNYVICTQSNANGNALKTTTKPNAIKLNVLFTLDQCNFVFLTLGAITWTWCRLIAFAKHRMHLVTLVVQALKSIFKS